MCALSSCGVDSDNPDGFKGWSQLTVSENKHRPMAAACSYFSNNARNHRFLDAHSQINST